MDAQEAAKAIADVVQPGSGNALLAASFELVISEACDTSYHDGHAEGWQEGWDEGNADGYEEGYDRAYEDCSEPSYGD